MKQVELSPDKTALLYDNGRLYVIDRDDFEYTCVTKFSGYETEELRKLLTQPNTNENNKTTSDKKV